MRSQTVALYSTVLATLIASGCDTTPAVTPTDAGVDVTIDRAETAADVPSADVPAVDVPAVDVPIDRPAITEDAPAVDVPGDAADAATLDAQLDASVDAPGDASVTDASSDATACPSDIGPLVTVNGTVYSNEDGEPIAGATVSVEDACPLFSRTTASNGGYGLRLPLGQTIFLRAASATTVPFLRGFVVPAAGTIQDYYVVSRAVFEGAAASLPLTLDPTKGHVWVSFENARAAGYGATLSAMHGEPITRAAGSDTAVTFSRVTLAGDLDHWFLLFPNVAVGTTTITLTTPAGLRCTPRQPMITDWLVRPGAVTYYEADCD